MLLGDRLESWPVMWRSSVAGELLGRLASQRLLALCAKPVSDVLPCRPATYGSSTPLAGRPRHLKAPRRPARRVRRTEVEKDAFNMGVSALVAVVAEDATRLAVLTARHLDWVLSPRPEMTR